MVSWKGASRKGCAASPSAAAICARAGPSQAITTAPSSSLIHTRRPSPVTGAAGLLTTNTWSPPRSWRSCGNAAVADHRRELRVGGQPLAHTVEGLAEVAGEVRHRDVHHRAGRQPVEEGALVALLGGGQRGELLLQQGDTGE